MQEKYTQNIKSYNTKFADMLNSTTTEKCVTIEKYNANFNAN